MYCLFIYTLAENHRQVWNHYQCRIVTEVSCFQQDQTLLWTCLAGEHLQCVNNHYAKFEDKGMTSVLITDYTQINNVSTPNVV